MGFGSALALFGVLAVAIPIVIHLIQTKKAPMVWVGDIRLFKGFDSKRLKPTSIDHWPLFILRILMVLIATLAIAKPYFQEAFINERPLALVTPHWLASASDEQIEQLAKGYEVKHLFWRDTEVDIGMDVWQGDLWALLSYYDEIQPQSQAFHVFTSDDFSPWFANSRPNFGRAMTFHVDQARIEKERTEKERTEKDRTEKDHAQKQHQEQTQAVIITNDTIMPALNSLSQALSLLGYQARFITNEQLTDDPKQLIVDVNNQLKAEQLGNNVIVKGGDWLKGYSQAEFIFTLRSEIESAYNNHLQQRLSPNLSHAKVSNEQLDVALKPNLYPQSTKKNYFDDIVVTLLVLLFALERLLSEYGYRRKAGGLSDD